MSNQDAAPPPSSSIYFPRVPTKPLTERFYQNQPPTTPENSTPEKEYVWNRPADAGNTTRKKPLPIFTGSSNAAVAEAESQPSIERLLEQRLLAVEKERREAVEKAKAEAIESVQQAPPIRTSLIWGIDYHALTMEETLEQIQRIIAIRTPSVAVTANLNYAMLCDRFPRLANFTKRAALVLCDGKPIQWRSRLSNTRLPERVAGSDLIYRLAELSQETQCSIYLYGAAEGIAEKAASELKRLYPGCKIAGVQCPSFRDTSEKEKKRQLDLIRKAKPDILLVALGQPKGEFWIEENFETLNVPLSIQVGASFDFVAGNAKRAPKIIQKIGAEWLYRMLHDPIRLVPRYFWNGVYLLKALRKDCIDALEPTQHNPTR